MNRYGSWCLGLLPLVLWCLSTACSPRDLNFQGNLNPKGQGAKYKVGKFHQVLGGKDCTGRCEEGPMVISPDPIEGCEGEDLPINVRIEGNSMAKTGDKVGSFGGSVDWGDGKDQEIRSERSLSFDLKHAYAQANTYYLSATYEQQSQNANNPRGGCSYVCRLQQAATVHIHLKSAPECRGGHFQKEK